jgi:transposase
MSALSPDIETVRNFITTMIARAAFAELVTAILGLLVRMRDLNTELVRKLAGHSRKRPPSETMRRLQLELPLVFAPAANDGPATPPALPPPNTKKKRGPKNRHAHARPSLPAHLPRVETIHPVTDAARVCPTCHANAKRIGFKTAEKLELKPAEYFVEKVMRETVACQHCHAYVHTAPKLDEVVDRGLLGDELLVQAMVDHYDNAVPFERIARSAAQQGVPLAANTLARSVGRLVDLFDAVVRELRERCLASSFTALDATRMPVLDPEHPLGIRSGALWLIEGDHKYACFFFAPSGHDDHLEKILSGRTLGSVMCDGSPTNNCVERAGGLRGGCNAHARRKLVEALRGGDTRALEGLTLFSAIFHVDAESARLRETIDQRFARRQKDSAPLAEKLRTWLDAQRAEVEPKSPMGQALGYLHRQWTRLTRYLRDPRMELTNNEVERDFRRWVLDRKTWMFVGHETSAHRAADALTLITTCKKFGLDPRRYLRDALAKILAGEKELRELLPERFASIATAPPSSLAA